MKTAEVTVVICNYNSSKYIRETLEGIDNQTFKNFCLLIIDDNSTDNSKAMIKDYLSGKTINYELIELSGNKGIGNARQEGLKRSNTKYVLFVDSDDIPHPTLLEKSYKAIKKDNSTIGVSSWSQFINDESKTIRGGLYIGASSKGEYLDKARRGKLFFYPIQCLFDREAALRVGGFRLEGFPEGKPRYQDFCEDLDLWTRMSDLYTEERYMITIPEVLYSYRKTGLGLSSNRLLMILKMKFVKINLKRRRKGDEEITFTDFLNSYSKDDMTKLEKEAEVATLLGNGGFLFNSGKRLKGLKLLLLSFVKDPSYLWQKLLANTTLFK